jgi:hypothetical protein
MIHVLCSPWEAEALKDILFVETTTLGIRQIEVTRHALPRSIETVEAPYGTVRFKGAPEYEDCRHLSERHDVPLRHIYRAAERSWHGDESVGALENS